MRGSASLGCAGLYDVFSRFYRLEGRLDSADPDDANTAVVRMATTVEQVGRHLWKSHLARRPTTKRPRSSCSATTLTASGR